MKVFLKKTIYIYIYIYIIANADIVSLLCYLIPYLKSLLESFLTFESFHFKLKSFK